ncbi:MAG TPA: hypothetical protein VGQ28_08080 [Thermoanaerobaculia bacterium]|jgi:hypothetical protein|nr:hypothetical protein [Thermoanaerobaculia bacterium]
MSAAQTFAQEMADWEALRTAAHDNAPNLPDAQRALTAFEDIMVKVQEMKARQDSFTATRQETTQLLNKLMADARELASRLRLVVKSNLGPKNERLVQFRIAPQRKPIRKAKTTPATTPAGGTPTEAPGTTPPPAPKPAA